MKQLSDCCKAEIKLTGSPEHEDGFACVKCGRIIGTPIKKQKPKELDKSDRQKFHEEVTNDAKSIMNEMVGLKPLIKPKELDWAERMENILGNREDVIKQLVGKIPEDKIIEGLKYFDETKRQLGELIQSLLTQQRTELLEEIKTRVDTWGGFEDDGGNLCHYDSEILEWVKNLLNKKN